MRSSDACCAIVKTAGSIACSLRVSGRVRQRLQRVHQTQAVPLVGDACNLFAEERREQDEIVRCQRERIDALARARRGEQVPWRHDMGLEHVEEARVEGRQSARTQVPGCEHRAIVLCPLRSDRK